MSSAADDRWIWRDGELVPYADATTHVLSHMAARGSQVFDVLPVVGNADGFHAVGLRDHVARFVRACDLLGMDGPTDVGALEAAVHETVAANPTLDAGWLVVKLIGAWVEEAVGVVPTQLRPTVFVAVLTAASRPSTLLPAKPVRVRAASMPKIPAAILPPSLKVAASYTPSLREQLRSRAEGFDHTIFPTTAGDLAESTTLSTLVVADGKILAPPLDSVLDGITRRMILDVADEAGVPVQVRPVSWDEVVRADELILCASTHPVLPVGWLDQQALVAPGPITSVLNDAVVDLLAGRHRLSGRWLTPLRT